MTLAEQFQKLLSQPNNAIVAVNRAEGGPQITPIWYVWDGESFYFSTTKDRAKYRLIQHDPAISLLVEDGPTYIAAYGKAEVLEDNPEAIARKILEKYVPADKVEEYLPMTQAPGRIIVKLHPDKFVTSSQVLMQRA
uniref:Pyridoxamine 5'-phosphate oxidase N-terminal domain-containing protein n=1 Tax=Thermosporothrix sp. COM3 TaxID=2490863 RepID=A0A455SJW2_9CHLR|nr:hypothetical protein KTC_26510 [Thermosporothrix sp. COM3]